MTIPQLNQELIEARLENSEQYLEKYLTIESQVIEQLSSFDGLQTELYLHQEPQELEQLKFATIFSDVVSIYMANSSPAPGSSKETQMMNFHEGSPFYKERRVQIPGTLASQINPETYYITPYHVCHTDADIRAEISQYKPLLEAGKSILRPVRALFVKAKTPLNELQQRSGSVYYADGNTSDDEWHVRDNFSRDSLPIKNYMTGDRAKTLFELTLPFFKTADLAKITKILTEETDTLSPLRKSLKDIVINFDEKVNTLEEIRQDVLRPQIDTINRKFRNYKSAHALRVTGGVGLFTVGLLQVHVPLLDVANFIAGVISGSGITGIFTSDMKYQEKLNDLRDDPYFLLWRIKRQPRL